MRVIASLLSILVLGLAASLAIAADPAPTSPSLTDAQKAQVEEVVRNLLTKKEPDLIIKAAQEMQARHESESAEKNQKAIKANKGKLFNDPNSFVGGNPKGDVTVVQFYDYQCGYCKMAKETVSKILETDKNVRFVFKEFPVLGPNSVQAAKASLASVKQGKFIKFHDGLLSLKEHLSDETIFKVAKDTGLDVEKLKKDMADPALDKIIQENATLGSEIGAVGTPSYVIGDQLYPGALPLDQMKKAIEDVRKDLKK